MKKALVKNSTKSILKNKKRFLSLLFMALLGVGFFAGLNAASPDMEDTLNNYLDSSEIYDINILATLGLTDEDITSLEEVNGIEKAYGVQYKDYLIEVQENEYVAQIIELNDNVNTPYIVEGKLPETETECILDEKFADYNNYKIGDKITIKTDDEEVLQKELTVVGTCQSALYISSDRGNSTLGTGKIDCYIYVKDILNFDYYTTIYLKVSGAKELKATDKKYEDLIQEAKSRVEEIKNEREEARYNSLIGKAEEELNKAKEEFENEKAKGQEEIDNAQSEINKGKNEINSNQRKIDNARKNLETQMAQAEVAIKEAETQISQNEANLENLKQSELANTDEGKLQIAQLEEGIRTAKLELEAQKQTVETSRKAAQNEIKNSEAKINSARSELKTAQQKLDDAKKEYDEKIADAEQKIKNAEQDIKNIEKNKWYIQTRKDNAGYYNLLQAIESITNLAGIFPIVFYIIAILISSTSMTRMVEEERTELGTLKALGYSNLSILFKYILYSSVACIIGGIIGMSIGFYLFPSIIWKTYGLLYKVPGLVTPFRVESGIIGLGIAFVCIVGATFLSCRRELKSMPANLMRPKAPKPGQRVLLERVKILWNHISFSRKVTIRNLFRYKKKALMTIIGIAGCTALTLAGFGLRDSITKIVSSQYGKIYKYDGMVYVKDNPEDVVKNLKQNDKITEIVNITAQTGELKKGDSKKSTNIIVPDNLEEFEKMCTLYDENSEKVKIENNGIIITDKMAEVLGISEGDTVTLSLTDGKEPVVKVSKIVKNYINHYVYMSNEMYKSIIGEPETNLLWINVSDLSKEEEENLVEEILQDENVTSVSMLDTLIETIDDMLGALDYIVMILIVASAILALTVLYNLANVNISERKREIATLKVLGFYDKEVDAYIGRESVIFTVVGILIGLAGGYFLTNFIITTCETADFRFIKEIEPLSYLYATAITASFSWLVNFVIHLTLKKIDMIESLKSVE